MLSSNSPDNHIAFIFMPHYLFIVHWERKSLMNSGSGLHTCKLIFSSHSCITVTFPADELPASSSIPTLQSTHSLFFSQSAAQGVGTFAQYIFNPIPISLTQIVVPCISHFQKPEFLRFMAGWPFCPAKCHLHQQVWTLGWANTWAETWTLITRHVNMTLPIPPR